MEYGGTSLIDLIGAIGSEEIVSEIVDGKRSIDHIQAKALGEYF